MSFCQPFIMFISLIKLKYDVYTFKMMGLIWTIRICVCLNCRIMLVGRSTLIYQFPIKDINFLLRLTLLILTRNTHVHGVYIYFNAFNKRNMVVWFIWMYHDFGEIAFVRGLREITTISHVKLMNHRGGAGLLCRGYGKKSLPDIFPPVIFDT